MCITPEFSESCPSDCGELVRNSRLLSHETRGMPFFWRRHGEVSTSRLSGVSDETFALYESDMISQSGLMLLPGGREYAIELHASDPSCLEVFIHSISSVHFAQANVTRTYWNSPEFDQDLTFSIRSVCFSTIRSVSIQPVPVSTNSGWKYSEIVDSILYPPQRITPEACRAECVADLNCCAWQVCPGTEQEGCQGCYLLGRPPAEFVEKVGWFASIIRSESIEAQKVKECQQWFLTQSSHESDFYDEKSGKIHKYLNCGRILKEDKLFVKKQIHVAGIHMPVIIVTSHRTPSPLYFSSIVSGYFFAIPFYDTNIGNVIKQTSSMNIVQSYEMQTILQKGDVFVDVGANLGSYTIPLADHVGIEGKVFAFEPFRWMHQLLNANVAMNGLMNCHVFQKALSNVHKQSLLLQPNLRHFSSPGGVKVANQPEDSNSMYDQTWGKEWVEEVRLDDIEMIMNGQRVDLIKIDVEGMESQVLLGAIEILKKFKPIVWVENVAWFESGDASLLKLMDRESYRCWKSTHAGNDLICEPKDGSRWEKISKVGKAEISDSTITTC